MPVGRVLIFGSTLVSSKPSSSVAIPQVHATTAQLSYKGQFAELTEAISNLPVGGQTLLSNHTLQLVANQLRRKIERKANARKSKAQVIL